MRFGQVWARVGIEVRQGAPSRQVQQMFPLFQVGLALGIYFNSHHLFRRHRRFRRRQFVAGAQGSLDGLSGDDLPRRLQIRTGLLEIGSQSVLVFSESLLDAMAQFALRRRFYERAGDLLDERFWSGVFQSVSDEAPVRSLD